MASIKELLVNPLNELVKDDLKKFQWYLKYNEVIPKRGMENADVLDTVDKMVERFGPEEAVKITVNILKKINQNLLAEQLENKYKEGSTADTKVDLHDYRKISFRLKKKLQQDYKQILVGHSQTDLNDIYTDLYVVENETGGIVSEHEVRQIELFPSRYTAKDTAIQCNDMFKVQSDTGQQNRKVLMMGIAGVGKTVSVNKFILDWAEEKENQDILFIFPLPFRRLNLIKKKYSLMGLINKFFFSDSEELPSLPEDDSKVMFIFDGLDECRIPLNFKQDDRLTDVHEKTTVSKIVTNLIKRHLVSSALIWITSRPAAAAGLIPRDYIDQVLEVQGFNDEQKEQYFIKNSNPEVAGNIIRHIRKSRSLYIMCRIPIFCWISRTVLQPLLARESNDKTPTTLTEMYTTFLLSQKQQMKYCDDPEPKPKAKSFDQIILKLGKLAFKQLQKGNLIFYKEDLEECGLDVSEWSVYSGLCTHIFLEEKAVTERKIYSFMHLSIQEFLAALYVFFKHRYSGKNTFLNSWRERLMLKLSNSKTPNSKKSLFDLHKSAINKALQSKTGHLDLFLLFLLGLSLESNQSDLKELLPELELKTENVKDTADYIEQTIEKEKSVESIINLFPCLAELKDDFGEDLLNNLSSGNLSAQNLSSAQWSALIFMLLISEETYKKSELQQFNRSDEAQRLPATPNPRRAVVDHGGQIMMRAGLRKYSCELTLDPNTAHTQFIHKPHTNNHVTQTTGSCNLKSSGLNIDPLLRCQACVHIADPDQWVQIEPSAYTDEGVSKFRVSTRPGRYECVRTRMRWVCDCDVTLQYHSVDGRFLNAELERLQCKRIAPVMDVTVISGKLEEVHLPHYACLGESEASLRDAVKVLSIEDEGSYVEPVQLTRFHAKLIQPSFSRKTLIISWKMRWDEHCDLLLYMRSRVPLILHVYLFPFDAHAKEKVEKIEKSSYLILHPRPDRPFRMKTPHILGVPGATVHPKEGITLRREMDPNFFKIKTSLENDLQMTLIRGQGKEEVWTATIEKDELDLIHPQRDESRLNSEADKARYFDDHWPDLIQTVKNVQIIADKLRQQQLIHEEQYSEITQSSTPQKGMRKLCDLIRKHDDTMKVKIISILLEEKLYHF